jgi:hypothetical protein
LGLENRLGVNEIFVPEEHHLEDAERFGAPTNA